MAVKVQRLSQILNKCVLESDFFIQLFGEY